MRPLRDPAPPPTILKETPMSPDTQAIVDAIGKLSFTLMCTGFTIALTISIATSKIQTAIARHSLPRR